MEKKIKFLKIAGILIKIVAWFLLLIGIITGGAIITGMIKQYPPLTGVMVVVVYGFSFLFLYTVAIIADILIEIKKEKFNL